MLRMLVWLDKFDALGWRWVDAADDYGWVVAGGLVWTCQLDYWTFASEEVVSLDGGWCWRKKMTKQKRWLSLIDGCGRSNDDG